MSGKPYNESSQGEGHGCMEVSVPRMGQLGFLKSHWLTETEWLPAYGGIVYREHVEAMALLARLENGGEW